MITHFNLDKFLKSTQKLIRWIDHVTVHNTLVYTNDIEQKLQKELLVKIEIIFTYIEYYVRKIILTFFSRRRWRRRFFNTTITINNKHKILLVLDARLCGMLWVCVFARTQNWPKLFELSAQVLHMYSKVVRKHLC